MPLSRRRFLAVSATAGALTSNSVEASWLTPREKKKPAAKPMPDVPRQPWDRPLVGCQLYGWGQYFQRAGRALDYDEIFSSLKQSGYDYAEGNLDLVDHGANSRFSQRLRYHGLVPVSLYTGGEFHLLGRASRTAHWISEAAKAAKKVGFEMVVCNPDPIGRDKTEAELAIQSSALAELGQELNRAGLKLGLHQHTPEFRNRAHEFHENFRRTKPGEVGWCLDTHWTFRGGVDPLAALRQYGDRICSWHLRQSRKGIWWEDLDDGDIDYGPLAQAARERRIPVRLTVELALEEGTLVSRDAATNHARSRLWVRRTFGV
jgi:inosose dehydratase